MSSNDLSLETASGVCTRSLVTAILESRRAYQLAMALAKQVLLTGVPISADWNGDALPSNGTLVPSPAWSRHTARPRPTDLRYSMRRRTSQGGLRLVTSKHFDSPLVMPAGAAYPSTGEPTNEHADDKRQLDAAQGRDPRDVGQADG